jgi:hypothetical protein
MMHQKMSKKQNEACLSEGWGFRVRVSFEGPVLGEALEDGGICWGGGHMHPRILMPNSSIISNVRTAFHFLVHKSHHDCSLKLLILYTTQVHKHSPASHPMLAFPGKDFEKC